MKEGAGVGVHLNPGNEAFAEVVCSDYVDKTELIDVVNGTIHTLNKLTCISRPRRFGKSIVASMIAAVTPMHCSMVIRFVRVQVMRNI